jgi:hypothetical protein
MLTILKTAHLAFFMLPATFAPYLVRPAPVRLEADMV